MLSDAGQLFCYIRYQILAPIFVGSSSHFFSTRGLIKCAVRIKGHIGYWDLLSFPILTCPCPVLTLDFFWEHDNLILQTDRLSLICMLTLEEEVFLHPV